MKPPQRTRPHWARRLGTGLAALVGTGFVVGGAPALLAQVAGNPLPRHVPSLGEIGELLTTPDNGSLFLRLLALVGWAAWATFTLSLLVEIPAQLRGRRPPRLPGLAIQQRLAAALVGAMIAVFTGASVATAALPSPVVAMVAPIQVDPPTMRAAAPPAALPGSVLSSAHAGVLHIKAAQAPIHRPVYIVARHDFLGKIAQRFTGDFERYRQIAALNPDLIRNPHRIQPGWRLVLPMDAYDRGVIRHATGRVLAPPALPPADPATAPPVITPGEPDPPASPAPRPSPDRAPALTPPAPDSTTTGDTPDTRVHALAAGAGLAAAGVLVGHVVVRRRTRRMARLRARRARAARNRRLAVPVRVDQARQSAKHRAADRLDAGLRRLTIGLGGRAAWQMPDVAAAWQHGGDVAIILATPCLDPPSPFEVRSPNTWSLPADAHVSPSPAPALLPGLLSVGTWAQGGELFVDGERTGLMSLVGNPRCCDDLLRFLAAEAATASWVEETTVIVAGFSTSDLSALAELNPQRVRVATSIDDAIARIAGIASNNTTLMRESGMMDTIAARVNNVTDAAWSTHLLFVADAWGEHTRGLQDLDAKLAALGRSGVVVVATQPSPSRWSAQVSADGSLEMAWLAVTGTTACQLSSEQLIEQAEAIRYARGGQASGARHRLRV